MSNRLLPRILAASVSLLALNVRAAAPTFPAHPDATDTPTTFPCGKTLVVPIAADDADGDALTYTVISSSPHIIARVKTGNPHVKMHVHTDNDGTGNAYDGDMEFQLYRHATPDTAAFLAGYAQSGYYDNVIFHRIIPGFVIQGGDPAGTGSGVTTGNVNLNLNYQLPHEFRPELIFTGRGQLAMANSGGGYSQSFPSNGNTRYRTGSFTATNGTQFFITLDPLREFGPSKVNLDFKHTVFGQLIRGFDVMTKVAGVPTNSSTDKPNVAVTMTQLSAAPRKTDAVLLLSAKAPGAGIVTVKVKDPAGNEATRTINVTVVDDTINDPPILDALTPTVMPAGGVPSFALRSADLESDAISTRFPVAEINAFGQTTQTIYAGVSAQNLQITSRPAAGAWDVSFAVTQFNDPFLNSATSSVSRYQLLEVGVGDKAIIMTPKTLEATEAVTTGTRTLATFRHGGAAAVPADFIAVVNWGDGSNRQSSSGANAPITIVRSATQSGAFEVQGAHTYARDGVYPLHVIVDGPSGATKTARGNAVVHPTGATLTAVGENIDFSGALFTGRPLAYFNDTTLGAKVADFSVTVDWGDGKRDAGTVKQVGAGRFAVFGTHRYVDATTYAVAVHVHRNSPSADAIAWSTIKIRGFISPVHFPPFAKANITSLWTESPVKSYRTVSATRTDTDVTGTLFIINGGKNPTSKWKLKFWLSPDATFNPTGANADTALKFGPLTKLLTELSLNPLSPGSGGNLPIKSSNGTDFTVRMPVGETGAGKFLIAQLVYNDPITDHMSVPKTVVFGPLPGILVSATSLRVKEGTTNNPLQTATFKVKLDTPPTQTVTIPIEIQNASQQPDVTRATLSAAQVVFNAGDAAEKIITVTSVDDATKNGTGNFTVVLKPATSTDTRFSGMNANDIALRVEDND